MLVIVSGSAGVGKNSLISEILKRNRNIKLFKSYTSRPMKPFEKVTNSSPYFHISEEEFLERAERGEFFEYEKIHNRYYGILKKSMFDIKNTPLCYIKDIDVHGYSKIKKEAKDSGAIGIFSVFLTQDKKVLHERLINEGYSSAEADEKLARYDFEQSYMKEYDLVVKTRDTDKTVEIIEEELRKKIKKLI